jgi:hypothetical protein
MSDPYLLAVYGHCYTMSCLLKKDSPNVGCPVFYTRKEVKNWPKKVLAWVAILSFISHYEL